jgi:hypothetical protein
MLSFTVGHCVIFCRIEERGEGVESKGVSFYMKKFIRHVKEEICICKGSC